MSEPSAMDTGSVDDTPADELLAVLGNHGRRSTEDERLDLPLQEQVKLVIELACDHNPGRRFTRTVPVQPTDHDVLIVAVLRKLIHRIAAMEPATG